MKKMIKQNNYCLSLLTDYFNKDLNMIMEKNSNINMDTVNLK